MTRALPSLLVVLLLALAAPLARAQTLHISDGRKFSLQEIRVVGDQLRIPIKTGDAVSGEMGIPVDSVVRLDWPAPDQLTQAATDLKAGKSAEALKKIDAVLPAQEVFRDITGSWWAQGMSLRVEALARLGRDIDAEVGVERLRRSKFGPPFVSDGALAIASALVDAGKNAQARERLKQIVTPNTTDATLARLALLNGRLLQSEGKTEPALLSYLQVTALYPLERDWQPAALLAAASCLRDMGDTTRATGTLNSLIQRFPESPEAAKARTLLSQS